MALNEFPRVTNKLLTQEEKCLLDDMPDSVVKTFLDEFPGQTKGTFTGIREDGVFKIEFEGERLTAVKDYFEMLFEAGIRERP